MNATQNTNQGAIQGAGKVWGKIGIVGRNLVRSLFGTLKENGQFLTNEFKIAQLIGANQQTLFASVCQRLKNCGFSWNPKNKFQLDPFLLTLVSYVFAEILLEEFDSIPTKTHVIRVTHATSSEREIQQTENEREIIDKKYPRWNERCFNFLMESAKAFGTLDEENFRSLKSDVKDIILLYKPVEMVRGGKSKVKIEERKTDQSKRAHFRLKLIVMKEKFDKSGKVPTPFVVNPGTVIPLDCHWHSQKFKWCSRVSESDHFKVLEGSTDRYDILCPVSHEICFGAILGKGQYGSVYECKFVDSSGTQHIHGVNCKSQKHSEGAAKVFSMASDSEAHDNFLNEVNMLSKLGTHPNTLGLLAANVQTPDYVVVTEKMLTSLSHFLYKEDDPTLLELKEPKVLVNIIAQIHNGIKHTHDCGVVHRDIKSQNILIRKYHPIIEVVVSDFGTASMLAYGETIANSKFPVGTPVYMAPEVARLEPYSVDIDIYSFAILAAEIISNKEPYEDEIRANSNNFKAIEPQVLSSALRPSLQATCPAELKSLLEQCWVDKTRTGQQRPTHQQIQSQLNFLLHSVV